MEVGVLMGVGGHLRGAGSVLYLRGLGDQTRVTRVLWQVLEPSVESSCWPCDFLFKSRNIPVKKMYKS